MPGYSQANRPLAVTTPLGQDVLLLVGFQGEEAISRLFHFQLDLLAERKTVIAFDRIVGRNITVALRVPGGGKRYFNGIVSRFSQGRRDALFTHYRAELVPQFWLWTRRAQCRIFQHLTVPEILKRVLDKLNVTFEITGKYQPRDYCVQYRETDFAFASRLMEEEGIAYYFRHTERDHPMVVTDAATRHPSLPGQASVPYVEDEGGLREALRITDWVKTQEVRSGRTTLWDHCFELPGRNLEAVESIQDKVSVGKAAHRLRLEGSDALEVYDYPGGYAQRFDGVDKGGGDRPGEVRKIFEDNKRTAKIRMEEEAAAGLEVEGAGTCTHFLPGYQFTLTGHFDAAGPYLLTRVEHSARLEGAYHTGGDGNFGYDNRFTGIPVGLPFRPRRVTPRPVIAGTQTATVVAAPGQEVLLDKYGRVKVQFPWDREGKKDPNSSCWVRVAQVWAGKRWGAFFWPRAGQEVVVAFEEGDPDRPIIVGSVYNAENMPPYHPTREPLVNGVKSCSQRGHPDKNYNAVIFYDKAGDEHTQIHSEKHQVFTNETSKHNFIGHAHTKIVGGLPLMGSGSGGQKDNAPKPPDDPLPGSYNLKDNAPEGSFGKDLDFSFGERFEGVLGLKFEQIVGGKSEYYCDPFSFVFSFLGGAAPMSGLLAGFRALFGKSEFKFCTESSFLYGPKWDLQRGQGYTWQGDMPKSPVLKVLLGLYTLLPLATVVAYEAEAHSETWSATQKHSYWFIFNLAWNAAEVLVTALETTLAVKDTVSKVLEEHKALAEQLKDLVAQPMRLLMLPISENYLKKIEADTARAAGIAIDLAGSDKKNPLWDQYGFPDVQVADGLFMRKGRDIELVAAWASDPDDPTDVPKPGYGILIDAQGGKEKDGNLMLNASKSLTMTCGTNGLMMTAADNAMVVECDKAGEITVRNPDPTTEPTVRINKEQVIVHVGPYPIEPLCSIITVTKDGITLQCGELSKIEMTMSGIKMSVADQSTIELKPTGVEINGMIVKMDGKVMAKLNSGVQHQHKAGAVHEVGGAITKIGG